MSPVPARSETDAGGTSPASVPRNRALLYLGSLILGYIGIYLCRKNLSVAIPMIAAEFQVDKAAIGMVASWSNLAYAAGKFVFGPVIDRFGGRVCFLCSLVGVALFGTVGALVTTLPALTLVYSANRLSGSAGWGAMVKLVPGWFAARQLPLAMALLSLGFVFGGVCATMLAGQIAEWSGNNWRMVMGGPVVVLVGLLVVNAFILPKATAGSGSSGAGASGDGGFQVRQVPELLKNRQFWIVCGLSFTLTLMRETFNTWTVDFFKTEGGPEMSNRVAAFLSTPFDALGALGILGLGWLFGRVSRSARVWLLVTILLVLTVVVFNLPVLFRQGLWVVTGAIGLIGFLVYGPYSLLAGLFSVEIRGPAFVATVAGVVDGVGYLAGFLAGSAFGSIVDHGGYRLGFQVLSGLTLISAVLCLFLYPGRRRPGSS